MTSLKRYHKALKRLHNCSHRANGFTRRAAVQNCLKNLHKDTHRQLRGWRLGKVVHAENQRWFNQLLNLVRN